jgi:hypothetical protein
MIGIGKAFTGLFVSLIAIVTAWSLLHLGAEPASTFKTTDLIVSNTSQLQGPTTVADFRGTQIAPTGITGATNNWAPTGLSTATSIYVTSSSGQILLNGLTGGTNGRRLIIYNADAAQDLVIRNENTGSTAANRFVTGFGDDVTLRGGNFDSVTLEYATIGGNSRWRLVAINTFSPPGMAFLGPISSTSTGSFGGALNMNSHLINNVTDPSAAQDAATKNYVDTHTTAATTSLGNGQFGDGLDGAQTFDGTSVVLGITPSSNTYTLTRDIFLTNATVNTGVKIITNGWRIFGTGTLTLSGTGNINDDATSGVANAAGTGGGGGSTKIYLAGTNGGAGGNGAVGGSAGGSSTSGLPRYCVTHGTSAVGTDGASLGMGGGGGDAASNVTGTSGDITVIAPPMQSTIYELTMGHMQSTSNSSQFTCGSGGGGGGSNGTTGKGGGGGGAGGTVFVAFRVLAGSGTITSKGGNGGDGTAGNASHTGGGGGGGGGIVIAIYNTNGGVTFSVAGGTKGAPTGTGTTAGNGAAGALFRFNLSGDGT